MAVVTGGERTDATQRPRPGAANVPLPWAEGYELPVYSPWRRIPEWEPHGRWLRDRPQIDWPDAAFPTRWVPWTFGLLQLAGLVLGQITMNGDWWRRALVVGLQVAVGCWLLWWPLWDLTPMGRRLAAWVVQTALIALIIALCPVGGLAIWANYLICGTLFTGPLMLIGLAVSAALMTAIQMGGYARLSGSWAWTLGLFAFNLVVGIASITVANRREGAVLGRNAVAGRLLAEELTNAALREQLIEQARLGGIRDERARLARDLHDTVAQGLVAVITQLEAIDDRSIDADARRRMDNAKDLARQGLTEARRAVHALSPADLDDRTLPDALRAIVSAWSERNRVATRVHSSGPGQDSGHDGDLILVCREALSNIARHARARSVAVTLTYLDDRVLLDVRDDGRGFDPTILPSPGPRGGHGLAGMRERLSRAHGELVIESEPGNGCVISASLPARRAQAAVPIATPADPGQEISAAGRASR